MADGGWGGGWWWWGGDEGGYSGGKVKGMIERFFSVRNFPFRGFFLGGGAGEGCDSSSFSIIPITSTISLAASFRK